MLKPIFGAGPQFSRIVWVEIYPFFKINTLFQTATVFWVTFFYTNNDKWIPAQQKGPDFPIAASHAEFIINSNKWKGPLSISLARADSAKV